MSKDFRDLLVWQKSMELVVLIYSLSHGFPAAEQFGLTSQLRRFAKALAVADEIGRMLRGLRNSLDS